jgi:pyridoxamine 5'-phosphate oxidase family protein
MSVFTETELAYLTSQPLGRLATVGRDGAPHVMPIGVFFDAERDALVVGSVGDMPASKKYRDARRNPAVAVVIDDVASRDPWTPRGLEIRGHAETFAEGGEEVGRRIGARFPFNPAYILIRPRRVLAWGLDGDPYQHTARDVAA